MSNPKSVNQPPLRQAPVSNKRVWPFVAAAIAGLLLGALWLWGGGVVWFVLFVVLTLVGLTGAMVRGSTRGSTVQPGGRPIAYTDDGKPIYPVVGYTSDGSPVTADRAIGVQSPNPRTNSFAIVALVMGFLFPFLAIPFGHAARAQIRQTGEQGGGMALAGLILGYIGVSAIVIVVMVISVAPNFSGGSSY